MSGRLDNIPVRVRIGRYDGSRTGLSLTVTDERSHLIIVAVDIPEPVGFDLLTGREVEAVAEFVNNHPNIGRWHQNKTVAVPCGDGYDHGEARMKKIYDDAEKIANAGNKTRDKWSADRLEGFNHHRMKRTPAGPTYEVTVRRWVGEEKPVCQAEATVNKAPSGEPYTVTCARPSGHAGTHASAHGVSWSGKGAKKAGAT